jgi:transposase
VEQKSPKVGIIISTSDLYHIWGLKGVTQLPGTCYGKEGTVFKASLHSSLFKCSACGSVNVVKNGTTQRTWHCSQVGSFERIRLKAAVQKVECRDFGFSGQVSLPFALPKKMYTRRFEQDVIRKLTESTVLGVAESFGVSWHTVNSILKAWLEKLYQKKDLKNIRRIAIDGKSIGKRHTYITIVINLDTGEPVYAGDGKAEKSLENFWHLLGKRRMKKIVAVAMDMGFACQAAVRKNLPKATIVFDKFHIVKLVNSTLDALRRVCFNRACENDRQVIAGTRFLLLKNPEDLDEGKGEKSRLERLKDLNTPLTDLYLLKEDIRQIWSKRNKAEARKAINAWIATATETGDQIITRLLKTVGMHLEGILAYYDHPITSGVIEGVNNKIGAIVRRAYGYRDMQLFKLMIYAVRQLDPRCMSPPG